MKKKNGVIKHLKDDIGDFKEEIREDKALIKKLGTKKKKKKK